MTTLLQKVDTKPDVDLEKQRSDIRAADTKAPTGDEAALGRRRRA